MVFNYVLGIHDVANKTINHREAVRAIILHNDKILLVHTNKGDYKFPGGGANKNESHCQTLVREVKEETGYIVNKVTDKIGIIIERKLDEYEKSSIFEMVSSYYLCEISDKKTAQQLDDYESNLEFQPEWISIDTAIQINEEILNKDNIDKNNWVERETIVLKELKTITEVLK